MKNIEIVKNIVDQLDGVMTMEIDPNSEIGRQMYGTQSNSDMFIVVSPLSDNNSDTLNSTDNIHTEKSLADFKHLSGEDCALTSSSNSTAGDVGLTTREIQVLKLITEGLSNKSIGLNLDISHSTVKAHVKNILSKLKIHSRLQAAIWAIKHSSQINLNEASSGSY